MIGVALKGLAGTQGPRAADRVRRRHRRLDGERHVRPHGHDAEGLRRHLHARPTTRPTPSSPARRSSRAPPAAAATVPEPLLAQGAGAARGRRGRRHDRDRRVQQGRDHRPRRQAGGVGRRPQARARQRHLTAAVQPAEAQRPASGDRGRSRSSSTRPRPRRSATRSATRSPSPRSATSTATSHRHRHVRRRRLARRRDAGGVRHRHRPDAAAQGGRVRRDLDRRQGGHLARRSSSRAVQPLVPASLELKDAQGAGRGRLGGDQRGSWASSATSCWASAASRCSSARS